jgi:hypothetical protein
MAEGSSLGARADFLLFVKAIFSFWNDWKDWKLFTGVALCARVCAHMRMRARARVCKNYKKASNRSASFHRLSNQCLARHF